MGETALIGERDIEGPPTLASRLHILARFIGVILAAIPTTTVPPMLLTVLAYRRYGNERTFQRIHSVFGWANFCVRRVLEMDVRMQGKERLDREGSRLMLVCNHQSYVDIPLIMGSLRIGAFLSKDIVAYLPVIGQIAWLAGTIYFRRDSKESRQRALVNVLRMCESSTPVVVFPEGTRSADGRLRDTVHLGALHSCHARGLRVGTFALDGTRYACPPSMDRYFPHQRVAIVVGETFDPSDFGDADGFARAVWEEVGRRFAEARAMRESSDWDTFPRP